MYSLGWMYESVVASMRDAVRVETEGLGQQGGRRTTSAAGSQWPAWSSAGPVTHTHTHLYINCLYIIIVCSCLPGFFSICNYVLSSFLRLFMYYDFRSF